MYKITIWAEFEDLLGIDYVSRKADIKLTIEGDMKKIDIVSQLDFKSGYEFEFDEYGEYCISLEHEFINYKENFMFDKLTNDIELSICLKK